MANRFVTADAFAKDFLNDIREASRKVQIETACTDEERHKFEFDLAFAVTAPLMTR